MLPYLVPMKDMDAKIGGNDFDRLCRWYRQGRLNRSHGIIRKRFPKTLTPRKLRKLIRTGVLENARFAAAVVVRGKKDDQPLLIRWDAVSPRSTHPPARHGLDPHLLRHRAPRRHLREAFPARHGRRNRPRRPALETRRAILADVRSRDFRLAMKTTRLKKIEDDE